MLITAKTVRGYRLSCKDGEIGSVKEFYFDDKHWAIRYLVAETGLWLSGRQVLISPHALLAVNPGQQTLLVGLTKKQIEDSPPLASDKPVSRQFEESYHGSFGWPLYWGGPFMWGASPFIAGVQEKPQAPAAAPARADAHLFSTRDVTNHVVHAVDGEIGHVVDFVIDEETWAIRYLIVDTKNGWGGKKVLISPHWIKGIRWAESEVTVNFLLDAVKHSPEYTPGSLITRNYESKLHGHYERRGYWIDDSAGKK